MERSYRHEEAESNKFPNIYDMKTYKISGESMILHACANIVGKEPLQN